MDWLSGILGSILGGVFGGGGGSASGTSGLSDYQQALLEKTMETQQRRMILQNPLYEMATSLAQALMPRSATQSGYLQRPNEPLVDLERPERQRPTRDAEGTGVPAPTYSQGATGGGGGSNTRTAAAIQALAQGGFGSGSLTGPTRTGTRGITVNTPATLLSRERLMR
jgi:hypothetical protein